MTAFPQRNDVGASLPRLVRSNCFQFGCLDARSGPMRTSRVGTGAHFALEAAMPLRGFHRGALRAALALLGVASSELPSQERAGAGTAGDTTLAANRRFEAG